MKRFAIIILVVMSWLPMAAQLNGSGYYRIRNVANPTHFITIANDMLSYTTAISTAAGGLKELNGGSILFGDPSVAAAAKARGLECAAKYLMTDIKMVEDPNCMDVSGIIYLKNSNGAKYDLVGQSTSLIEITTGTYPGTITLEFSNIYATITKSTGTGANTQYTAKVELKASNYSAANLGTRYFVDDNGTFAINESSSGNNAKWYLQKITSFNVNAPLSYKGKYYCTMYTPFAYKLSGQTWKAWVITGINEDGTLQKKCIAANANVDGDDEDANVADAIVPAGTPVVLECHSNVPSDCQLTPQGEPRIDEETEYTGTNLLKGAYFCNTDGKISFTTKNGTSSFDADNYTKYVPANMLVFGIAESPIGVSRLGFFPYNGDKMKSNKVWLDISGSNANTNFTFGTDEPDEKGVAHEYIFLYSAVSIVFSTIKHLGPGRRNHHRRWRKPNCNRHGDHHLRH